MKLGTQKQILGAYLEFSQEMPVSVRWVLDKSDLYYDPTYIEENIMDDLIYRGCMRETGKYRGERCYTIQTHEAINWLVYGDVE